jgi:hypothetical protein
MMESPMNPTLKLRPKGFNAVGVNLAIDIFQDAMPHRGMSKTMLGKRMVAQKLICEHRGTGQNLGFDVANQCDRLTVGNHCGIDNPLPFDKASHNRLAFGSASTNTRSFAADISFIRFNNPLQNGHSFCHQLPDLMIHPPCRLVGDSGLPHQFHGRNAIAASCHNEHGVKPRLEGRAGLMEDRPGSRRNLETAPCTGELFALGNPVETVGFSTLACGTMRKLLIEKVLQTGVIIRELLIEVLNRIFHFHARKYSKSTWTNAVQLKRKSKMNQIDYQTLTKHCGNNYLP